MYDTYAEIFAERGAAYHRAMAEHPRARDSEFQAVIEPMLGRPGGLLCDLPSGGGYLAEHLPPGMTYVGVDPSDDFIDACPPGLTRIKAHITEVPLDSGSIDFVVSLAALHHEPDLAAVFAEIRRLLRPSGRAVLADVDHGTPPATFLNGFVNANNPMGHDGHFLDDHCGELLGNAGFRIVSDELVETIWRFDTPDEAGAFGRQLFWMPDLTPSAVAEAMDSQLGFERDGDGVRLLWPLRRIVCDVG